MRDEIRSFVVAAAFLAVAAVVVVSGLRGQEAEPLDIQQVKDGLYVITGPGGNVGVRVTGDGVVLVDNKFERNHDAIMGHVQSVTDQPVTYVMGTHHHGDHMGGNPLFSTHAQIIGHQNNRDNMIRGDQPSPPTLVFADETSIFVGEAEVRAHHFGQGHTNGDAIIYFPDLGTIHGGDLLHGIAPFIDYGNGGSSKAWITTLEGALELEWDTAIPGHGDLMTRADVEAFRDQMVSVRARMTELIGEGVTREQAADKIRTTDLSWTMAQDGLFMRRSIEGFYDELAAER
jgi:cyclase